MLKIALTTAMLVVAACTSAMAETQVWNVVEQSASGIKSAQGTWALKIDDKKVSGSANMQFDNGNTLTYSLGGSQTDAGYTVSLDKRTDGKNGCVWTGKPATDAPAGVLRGEVLCSGNVKFFLNAAH